MKLECDFILPANTHLEAEDPNGKRRTQTQPLIRKERRKAARVQKRQKEHNPRATKSTQKQSEEVHRNEIISTSQQEFKKSPKKQEVQLKPILKKTPNSNQEETPSDGVDSHVSPSQSLTFDGLQPIRDKLAVDDAEIKSLEKALGIRSSKKLPRSFQDDGLDSVLDGLEDEQDDDSDQSGKRKRDEDINWLQKKRRKTRRSNLLSEDDLGGPLLKSKKDFHEDSAEESDGGDHISIDTDGNSSEGSESFEEYDPASGSEFPKEKRARENPFVAPKVPGAAASATKYIPPSLRASNSSDTEDLSRLRRQIQGHMNRLSEANLISVLGEIETLYRNRPRQHVSTTLIDILLETLLDASSLQDTFIILHAGFIAALYKVVGTDFGAQVIQRIDGEFQHFYKQMITKDRMGKKMLNLVSLLSELYTFQVVGSGLIYDFIRLFIQDFSESNTELLLKVIRSK